MASAYHWEARRRQMALDRRRHYQLQQELKNKKIENDLEEQRYCMGLEPYQRYHSPSPEANTHDDMSPGPSHQNSGAYMARQPPEDLRGSYMIPKGQTVGHCMCQCQCHYQGQGQYQSSHQAKEEDVNNNQDEVEDVIHHKSRNQNQDQDLYYNKSKSQDRDRTMGKSRHQNKSQVQDQEQSKSQRHHTGHHDQKNHTVGHQQASHHPQEHKHSAPETHHLKRGKRYTATEYVQQW